MKSLMIKVSALILLVFLLGSIAGCGKEETKNTDVYAGKTPLDIYDDSMFPTFEKGDTIYVSPVKDASELHAGDIITYWTVIDGERVLNTHRIVEIYDSGTYLAFATKGDNNDTEDSSTVYDFDIVGVYSRYNAKTGEDEGATIIKSSDKK